MTRLQKLAAWLAVAIVLAALLTGIYVLTVMTPQERQKVFKPETVSMAPRPLSFDGSSSTPNR